MTVLLTPKESRSDRMAVLVATLAARPRGARLRHPGGTVGIPDDAWQSWQGGGLILHHQELWIDGLSPRTSGWLHLEVEGQTVARARLTTLPRALPGSGERPLTFVLGSCFCAAKDPTGRVDAAYARLAPDHRPDFKILCGDQVYLDSPWTEFLRRHSVAWLRRSFLQRYLSTWAGRPGLAQILADGANFFSSDDHELWNNAPSRGSYVRDSWFAGKRDAWRRVATQLYRIFQTPRPWTSFDVPPLSFYVADTRIQRDADERSFLPEPEMARLEQWLAGLQGPGVLVLGQPLFAEEAGWMGHFADWGLADFEQYGDLVRAVRRAAHSLLVLTGDVHYRRFARTRGGLGSDVIEVISSPLALVDEKARGEWKAAPDFPAVRVQGAPAHKVETDERFQGNGEHFLVFQCTAIGGEVFIRAFDYGVDPRGRAPTEPAFEFTMR